MTHQLKVGTSNGSTIILDLAELPDNCPWCHQGCSPKYITGFISDNEPKFGDKAAQLVFKCPWNRCQNFFIVDCVAGWSLIDHGAPNEFTFLPVVSWPTIFNPAEQSLPEEIRKLSPKACQILQEAKEAELHNLSEIAGPGYRKALEFLVKDYLISRDNEKAADIKKMGLSDCISRIEDKRIKTTALRATWLGNDETHYERVWMEHDLEDLKILLKQVVNWIDSDLLTDHYDKKMPKSFKQKSL